MDRNRRAGIYSAGNCRPLTEPPPRARARFMNLTLPDFGPTPEDDDKSYDDSSPRKYPGYEKLDEGGRIIADGLMRLDLSVERCNRRSSYALRLGRWNLRLTAALFAIILALFWRDIAGYVGLHEKASQPPTATIRQQP